MFLDQLLPPYKYYGSGMSGILFFIFASCEPLRASYVTKTDVVGDLDLFIYWKKIASIPLDYLSSINSTYWKGCKIKALHFKLQMLKQKQKQKQTNKKKKLLMPLWIRNCFLNISPVKYRFVAGMTSSIQTQTWTISYRDNSYVINISKL